jgi:hypothetical protein
MRKRLRLRREELQEAFATALRAAVRKGETTVEELAKEFNVDRATVARWLGGHLYPATKVKEIEAFLGRRWQAEFEAALGMDGEEERGRPAREAELSRLARRLAALTSRATAVLDAGCPETGARELARWLAAELPGILAFLERHRGGGPRRTAGPAGRTGRAARAVDGDDDGVPDGGLGGGDGGRRVVEIPRRRAAE